MDEIPEPAYGIEEWLVICNLIAALAPMSLIAVILVI